MNYVDSAWLLKAVNDGGEYALLDVRERARYAGGHLLLAINLPLSGIELRIRRYVPRLSSRVVLCDDGTGLAERAARLLATGGYSDVSVLEGGVGAWRKAGHEVFRAHYAMTYAFGLYVEQRYGTPNLSADELKTRMDRGDEFVLVDARPIGEVGTATIPGARSVPFSELAYRVRDLLPDDKTQLIVHCGAVTRGVLGTESLIEAGLKNPILMASNGVRGWAHAGYELERGCERRYDPVTAASLEFSVAARDRVARNHDVKYISHEELAVWRTEANQRTLHLVDIRTAEEYASGHVVGSISVVGSELVGLYEDHIGTMNARVCLIDDNGCRAATVASWLVRMGWPDVVVLKEALCGGQLAVGDEPTELLLGPEINVPTIDAPALALRIETNNVAVVDFSSNANYNQAHVPGSWWTTRAYLAENTALLPSVDTYVTTAQDPELARLAAHDLQRHCNSRVLALEGGNNAWTRGGNPMSAGAGRVIGSIEDAPLEFLAKPNDDQETARAANTRNIEWQQSLLPKLERDTSFAFPTLQPRTTEFTP